VRLHVVTGKGGTGKTTVAAALALALASAGRKVLLIEVEGRQKQSPGSSTARRSPYEERKVATGLGAKGSGQGGDVYALAVDRRARCSTTWRCHCARQGLTRPRGRLRHTSAPGPADVLVTALPGALGAQAGRDLAFLVGERRAVEEPGDALPALDLDQQDLAAGAGQGERQRAATVVLPVPPLPVTTCSRTPSQSVSLVVMPMLPPFNLS